MRTQPAKSARWGAPVWGDFDGFLAVLRQSAPEERHGEVAVPVTGGVGHSTFELAASACRLSPQRFSEQVAGVGGGESVDTDIVPLGERAQRSILDHVLFYGDEAETNYLEVKSTLDVTSKEDVAKVAKFLLGAANRRPQQAARYFRGYAVLVIGAQKGRTDGVARGVEAHELEDRLRPYLGPQFPVFEFGRIGVGADREVLFVIAQPPQDGQSIFPCHKDFQGSEPKHNLDDGGVYVRGASNTRRARAGDVLALVERARGGGKPPIELDIDILGAISRVERVDEVLERLYEIEEDEFTKSRPATGASSPAAFLAPTAFGQLQPASPKERAERLRDWKSRKPELIDRGRAHFLGVALPGAGIRVLSHDRFVAKPHLIVTFHDCEAFEYHVADHADITKVVEPVIRQQGPWSLGFDPSDLGLAHRDYPVDWKNRGNDVEVVLTPESFRPNVPWTSDQDDYVLLARNPHAQTVAVTWILTEDGSDTTTTGEREVTVGDLSDAAELFQAAFLSDA